MTHDFLFPVFHFSSLIFIPSLTLPFAVSSSVITFPYASLDGTLFLSLTICFCCICFYPLQSHNLESVLCQLLLSLSSLEHLPTPATQLQAFLSCQCFSLQLPIHFHSVFSCCFLVDFNFPSSYFHLISPILFLDTSNSLFSHFRHYHLSSPSSCFFQVSVFFKTGNFVNFRCPSSTSFNSSIFCFFVFAFSPHHLALLRLPPQHWCCTTCAVTLADYTRGKEGAQMSMAKSQSNSSSQNSKDKQQN